MYRGTSPQKKNRRCFKMLKTVKVIRLAPGESLFILTDHGPNPVPPPDAAAAQSCPLLVDPQDDDKIVALVRVA